MVVVVNFGGQYAHLIARRIRELGVKSELVEPSQALRKIIQVKPEAIILSGSPHSVYQKKSPKLDNKIFNFNIPTLGICYGLHLITNQFGGTVQPSKKKQFGRVKLKVEKSILFNGLSREQLVWFSHGDQVKKIPLGFIKTASTNNSEIAAIENKKNNIYALQFHPEVTHTKNGKLILKNFIYKIAKCKKSWNLKNVKNQIIQDIKNQTYGKTTIIAISGGVDSLVTACLIKIANPKNLHLVLIDTGLMRKNEIYEIENILKRVGFKTYKIIKASTVFLNSLKGVIDPEEKRKIISKIYFEIFGKEAKSIKNVDFLAQGTIYPDRIESAKASAHADKIKSHHNVNIPNNLNLIPLEPLANLYKDEVRKIGMDIKIPEEFVKRHPFPGPALAIRILGEVTPERLSILRDVDEILISELKSSGYYNKLGQALAALLPIKSVGVMGDMRTYSYIVAIRVVNTEDFMTADWTRLPHKFLENLSSRIVNEVKGVNRVLYDITQKPPATIEYE